MIRKVVKLAIVGSVVRRIAKNPAVATPAKSVYRRFAKRRAGGRWHDVPPPGE